MKNKPLGIVFLGCGKATGMHSKTITGMPGIKRYFASRDKNKADSFLAKYNGSGTFGSYEDAIAADQIDVVFVATPPAQHLDQTVAALENGKHVIVEKPPFLSSKDFDTIQTKQAETGRQVFVAENYYYKPLAYRLRSLLQSGVVGELLFMHFNALKEQKIDDWRADLGLSGGGALFEGGIHWINFVANLGPELVDITGYQPAPKNDFEQSILCGLKYKDGPVGSLYYSWETPSLFKGLRLSKIYGRKGSITFESNGLFILVRGEQVKVIFPGIKDIAGYRAMFEDFFDSIRENKDAQFNLTLARRDLELIETAYSTR